MRAIVDPKDDYKIINLDAVAYAALYFEGYERTDRCRELLYLEDIEVNPNARELTEAEKKELEKYARYKIVFELINGKEKTFSFNNIEEAKFFFKKYLI